MPTGTELKEDDNINIGGLPSFCNHFVLLSYFNFT